MSPILPADGPDSPIPQWKRFVKPQKSHAANRLLPVTCFVLMLPILQHVTRPPTGDVLALAALRPPRAACLPHVLYDKPVKTGSTAVTLALRKYLRGRRSREVKCSMSGVFPSCLAKARELCGEPGAAGLYSILGHLRGGDDGLIGCLRRKGFYTVTSIREPGERWTSAFLYNRGMRSRHFGIAWNASFEEFMERMPRCDLVNYYDGLGDDCGGAVSVEERVERIARRFDEVIELGHGTGGELWERARGRLEMVNVSKRPGQKLGKFDAGRLKEERMLYERLRQVGRRGQNPERVPC